MTNLINLSDSYKFSHFNQYPKGTETIHSYLAPRGGEYEEIVMHGLPYILKEYLQLGIVSSREIRDSGLIAMKHSVPFYKEGWDYILEKYNGDLPIIIKALPEGAITKPNQPLLTIENTDPNCAWLVGYLETLLLKIWYPITIASKSRVVRKMLEKHWHKTVGDISGVDFAYHNFGDRGSSSVESAAIGGVAHLTQFKGTDNFNCLEHSNNITMENIRASLFQQLSIQQSQAGVVKMNLQ
jgi:nicotinamide phosphoribosyltransferase